MDEKEGGRLFCYILRNSVYCTDVIAVYLICGYVVLILFCTVVD